MTPSIEDQVREKILSTTGMCSGPYDSPHRCSALHCVHCGLCDESENLIAVFFDLIAHLASEAKPEKGHLSGGGYFGFNRRNNENMSKGSLVIGAWDDGIDTYYQNILKALGKGK